MIEKFVKVDRFGFRVAINPSEGHKNVLLIVNGIGANIELLNPFVDEISDDIEVVRFDIPGVGGSPSSKYPYRLKGIASSINKLMEELGYNNVCVMGISWGGALAQQLAYEYPRRFSKLILAATSMGMFMLPGSPKVLFNMMHPLRYVKSGFMEDIAPLIYGGHFRDNPKAVSEHFERVEWQGTSGYLHQLFAISGWTSFFWLHKIKQPTLVLAGDDDPIIPVANAKLIASRIKNSELHIVHGGGHLFPLNYIHEVVAEVHAFIAGN